MRIMLAALLVLVEVTASFAGLSTLTRRKSYSVGDLFTTTDYHADLDHFISAYNQVVPFFPGDSLKRPIVATDTIAVRVSGGILVKDPLISVSASDSLNYHLAHIRRVNADTLTADTVGFHRMVLVDSMVSPLARITTITNTTLNSSTINATNLSVSDSAFIDTLVANVANITTLTAPAANITGLGDTARQVATDSATALRNILLLKSALDDSIDATARHITAAWTFDAINTVGSGTFGIEDTSDAIAQLVYDDASQKGFFKGSVTIDSVDLAAGQDWYGMNLNAELDNGILSPATQLMGVYSRLVAYQDTGHVNTITGAEFDAEISGGPGMVVGTTDAKASVWGVISVAKTFVDSIKAGSGGSGSVQAYLNASTANAGLMAALRTVTVGGANVDTLASLWLKESASNDFSIYQEGTAPSQLGGQLTLPRLAVSDSANIDTLVASVANITELTAPAANIAGLGDTARQVSSDTATALRSILLLKSALDDSIDSTPRSVASAWTFDTAYCTDSLFADTARVTVLFAPAANIAGLGDTARHVSSDTATALRSSLLLKSALDDSIDTANRTVSGLWTFSNQAIASNDSALGLRAYFKRTGGTTDTLDNFYGVRMRTELDNDGKDIGYLEGLKNSLYLTNGNLGNRTYGLDATGFNNYVSIADDSVWGGAYGMYSQLYVGANVDTVKGNVAGAYVYVSDATGGKVKGRVSGLEMGISNGDWGILFSSAVPSLFGGDLTLDVDGNGTPGDHDLEISNGATYSELDAGEAQFTVSSSAALKDLGDELSAQQIDQLAAVFADSLPVRQWQWKKGAYDLSATRDLLYTDTTDAAITKEAWRQLAHETLVTSGKLAAAKAKAKADAKHNAQVTLIKLAADADRMAAQKHVGLTADDSYKISRIICPDEADPTKRNPNHEAAAEQALIGYLIRQNRDLVGRVEQLEGDVHDLSTRVQALEAGKE